MGATTSRGRTGAWRPAASGARVASSSVFRAALVTAGVALLACQADPRAGAGYDDASSQAPRVADGAEQAPGALGYAGGATADADEAAEPAPAVPAAAPRKLVRTVQLVLTVEETEGAAERVEALVTGAGGYVASSDATRRPDELLHVRMTLRVPVERLDEVVAALRDLAQRVERQSVATEDVTDQYVDLEARLRALRATEEELTELLDESRDRGHSAEDIMAIYRELTGIRSQIEQLQGHLQQLDDRTTYSTIHLELRPVEAARPLVDEGWQPGATFRNSVRGLVSALQWLADAAIVLIVAVGPVLLLVGLGIWLLLRLTRRLRARRPAVVEPGPPPPEA